MPSREYYIKKKYGKSLEEYEADLIAKADLKVCNKCKQEKHLAEFDNEARNTGNKGKGVASSCKVCRRAAESIWRSENEEHVRGYQKEYSRRSAKKRRGYQLNRDFGITQQQYDDLLSAQNGRCAICLTDTPRGQGVFHVDHDHSSGAIRGLLCHRCNTGMGLLGDTAETLRKALGYLEAHAAKVAPAVL